MHIRVRLNLMGVPLLARDVELVRKMVAEFSLLEKVSTKMLVGRDLSGFEITALYDRLEDIPNTICVTLGDVCHNIAVNIFNAPVSQPLSLDISPLEEIGM